MVSTIRSVKEFDKNLVFSDGKLVVVEFYATWCGPCKEIDPHLRALATQYKNRAVVIKVNVDKFSSICDHYNVQSIPTFVFIKNKNYISSFAGADPKLLTQTIATLSN